MARMACTAGQAPLAAAAIVELALAPIEGEAQDVGGWSIDDEPMGPGWHDSSWMLRRGLDVTEGVPLEAMPPEWQWRWWIAASV